MKTESVNGTLATSKKSAKRQEKKNQIALSAIRALNNLGYANTSLRYIADNTDLSLGMLHYYFEDKNELMIYCVRLYKMAFLKKLSHLMEPETKITIRRQILSKGLTEILINEWKTHRIWYDIRNQSMFEAFFQPIVEEVELGLIQFVEKFIDNNDALNRYLAIDRVFQHYLQKLSFGAKCKRDEIINGFNHAL